MNAGGPNIVKGVVTKKQFNEMIDGDDVVYARFENGVYTIGVCKDRSEKECNICYMRGECPISLERELG